MCKAFAPNDQRWPSYRDGTPVRIGDLVISSYGPIHVAAIEVSASGYAIYGDIIKDRIPVPKSLGGMYEEAEKDDAKIEAFHVFINTASFDSSSFEWRANDPLDIEDAEMCEIWSTDWEECEPAWPLDDERHPYNWPKWKKMNFSRREWKSFMERLERERRDPLRLDHEYAEMLYDEERLGRTAKHDES